ncbi:hypothetical protein QBC45DRAFT_53679 [Copromyces sp. CBS 386.78]|nr:hypothetical protein QBC45DRAFT_53679 [Copromyces sp. CBS 386.78]
MPSKSSRPSKRPKTSHNGPPLLVTRVQPHRQCANRPPRFWRFLELPAEIRNLIYSKVLTIPTAHDVAHVWDEKPRFDLSLLHVNKQISHEAAFVLYSTNTFVFLEPCDEHREAHPDAQDHTRHRSCNWLRTIGPKNARSVRNLHIRIRAERFSHLDSMSYNPDLILEVAGLAPNVTRLAIIAEKHAMQTRAVSVPVPAGAAGYGASTATGQQQTGGQAMETHWHRHWDPNHVAPINTWTLYQMRIGLRKFPNLICLVLAGFQRSDTFFRPIARLINKDRHCRIHVVRRTAARRTGRNQLTFSTLWNEEAVLDQMGRFIVRQELKKGGGAGSCGSGGNRTDATTGAQNTTTTTTGQNVDPGGLNASAQDSEDDDHDDAASDDGWQDIEALISESGAEDDDDGEEDDMIV